MQTLDIDNIAFSRAVAFVNQTNQPVFITGKAGTGKTTFLKYVRDHSPKKMAIAAPTGVAAMHAGGTTLHALFWLPFGTFIEDYPIQWNDEDNHIYNKSRLFSTIKLTRQRRSILQQLELLVIDEVSMVRADTLDAIDTILKTVRRDMRPFGGLQVLLIGDLYQLPPVVKEHEWQLLRQHYQSPHFFDAKVLRESPPVILELQKIYRQQDAVFINVLNKIRDNKCEVDDLELLNEKYAPGFVPPAEEQYITLTSHNRLAYQINQEELATLPGKLYNVNAVVRNDFMQSAYPTEEVLTLKEQAQVMFIKNDTGEDRRYFNGKIGTVKQIDLDKHQVIVSFPNDPEDVIVKRETWENIRYSYSKGEDKISEEVLGTFSQFPLRLAWAITIHKSQGLTFDRAIIDAGTSFAAGQVYVALSRLRSLEGLVLRSKIPTHAIRTDPMVVNYMQHRPDENELQGLLAQSQRQYLGQILLQTFRWTKLVEEVESQVLELESRNIDQKDAAQDFFNNLKNAVKKQEQVANKFAHQLQKMLSDKENVDYTLIHQRTQAATDWFLPEVDKHLSAPLDQHISEWKIKKRTKKYISELQDLLLDVRRKQEQLRQSLSIAQSLSGNATELGESIAKASEKTKVIEKEVKKEEVSETKAISLELFQRGMSIFDIAQKRNMVEGTIYAHLIHFVGSEIDVEELIEPDRLKVITDVILKNKGKSASEIKMILGQDYDYPEIRLGQKYLEVTVYSKSS